jgi:short subunit dehydrogenase-like uncharacterized protein
MSSSRAYSLVLLGATGYTGKLCAEYITKNLPTNLKWAVAGRSSSKLQDIVEDLKRINPDRLQPNVISVNLNKEELDNLAKKTRVLLNCVGPYHLYSTPVVAACAQNGTHYLDVTGETPWVRELLEKYHDTARANNAILIPEIGIESAPSDLMAYIIASTFQKSLNCGVRDVICAVHEFKGGPSGGSLATALGLLDHYSLSEVQASMKPFALSPAPPPKPSSSRPFLSRILGPFSYPGLGILTTSLMAAPNVAIVQRSSGLMPQLYGSNFHFAEYMEVSNYAFGVLVHFAIVFGSLFLAIKPLRSLVRRFGYQPGQGPTAEATANNAIAYRAIGVADDNTGGKEKKAMASMRYDGAMYYFTGLLLAEAAMVLLENQDLVDKLGGGLLTPACLGDKFIERLQKAGVKFEGDMLPDT